MARVDTLPEYLRPLMDGKTVRAPYCVVCGRSGPLNQHHVVRRGAGKLFRDGAEVEKPTLTLCGFGNNMSDADGREYCHGLAHANRLHFRWRNDRWEYLRTDVPTRYYEALEMDGWLPLREPADW